jgi:nitrate reductase gamma subunit
LLGCIIITGFVAEGARIAMTGNPPGSQYAFIGFYISKGLRDFNLNEIYSYLWYIHAVISAIFIAYIPFSRMFHIFIAPLSLLLNRASRD